MVLFFAYIVLTCSLFCLYVLWRTERFESLFGKIDITTFYLYFPLKAITIYTVLYKVCHITFQTFQHGSLEGIGVIVGDVVFAARNDMGHFVGRTFGYGPEVAVLCVDLFEP